MTAGGSAAVPVRACGRAALLLLAAALPFEMTDPIARVGPLQLSSVEVFLYLALAVWGLSLVAGWVEEGANFRLRLRRLPAAHRAVAAFGLVVLVSAVAAPASRASAVKFALRTAGGLLLYAAATDLLRAPEAVARTAKALVGGALVAALLVLAEARGTLVAAWLRPFHAETFEALGRTRASGPFQYPNIAAMYLEASVPVAAGIWASGLGRWRAAALALVLIVLLDGVLATGSRAGLVGASLAALFLGVWFARTRETRAAGLATLVALLALGGLASTSALAGRFRFWRDGDWYRAVIAPAGGAAGRLPSVLVPSGVATEILEVQNRGSLLWSRSSASPVALSYHWVDPKTDGIVERDGFRTLFPADLGRGGVAIVVAKVRAPTRPGRYVLWWDLVQEGTTWFSQRGSPGMREEVVVRGEPPPVGAAAPAAGAVPPAGPPLATRQGQDLPRHVLWRAAWRAFRARPLLGIGPDNFRHLSRQFLGRTEVDERMHANSLYFETLADLGAVGLLAFAVVLVALAGATRRALAAPATRILALGVGVALATYLLHGALDYFLEFTPTYALFWLLAGMLVAMDSSGTRSAEVAA